MDNQDKIFDKFKEAAQNAETKDFQAMEKIWSRVEEKLDKKEDKKAISLWKKIAVAASLLLLISLGAQFLKSDKTAIPNPSVVVNETETPQNPVLGKENTEVSNNPVIISKTERDQILDKQIKQLQKVAVNEAVITAYDSVSIKPNFTVHAEETSVPDLGSGYLNQEDNVFSKDKKNQNPGYSKPERESFIVTHADQQSPMSKKSAPLIVLNGTAIAHGDDAKRDKMMQKELPNLKPENVDSLIVLDEPLYIIDGIYYSENDLFGTNPTSPYAPLNKQEIKTITVLQDLEATSQYGDKGKKGVVIITTKAGKPYKE
jgi:hypothetical protein